MRGERIEFDGHGSPCVGYLSRSATGSGSGVIVLQEWWGLVGHIQDVADRFADAGFTALAPDLYFGEATTEPTRAGELMMALNIGATERILAGAVDRLLADAAVSSEKVGVVGFCMGGQLSLFAATINPKIGACVDFYGIHPKVEPNFAALACPVLGLFAEHDAYASPEAVELLSREIERHGKSHEFVTYPGTHHAFFNDSRPEVFDREAAEDAWNRVLVFFRKHLN